MTRPAAAQSGQQGNVACGVAACVASGRGSRAACFHWARALWARSHSALLSAWLSLSALGWRPARLNGDGVIGGILPFLMKKSRRVLQRGRSSRTGSVWRLAYGAWRVRAIGGAAVTCNDGVNAPRTPRENDTQHPAPRSWTCRRSPVDRSQSWNRRPRHRSGGPA